MSNKHDLAATAMALAVADVLQTILSNNFNRFIEPVAIQHNALENFYIMVGELPIDNDDQSIVGYYSVGLVTPKNRYTHDIIDIIHYVTGISFRFCGLEIVGCIFPDQLYMDQGKIDAMLTLIINSDKQLQHIISSHTGGPGGIKKVSK